SRKFSSTNESISTKHIKICQFIPIFALDRRCANDYYGRNDKPAGDPNGDDDGDGWSNQAEINAGTDPNDPNSKPLGDPNADDDGDGWSNDAEYAHGTDRSSKSSKPAGIMLFAGGGLGRALATGGLGAKIGAAIGAQAVLICAALALLLLWKRRKSGGGTDATGGK
ncbi:MAG: hypothetical protein LBR77_00090, partial [Lachnospiraceae bacterium]|nr:hypothetical protein [Lachnospiraceae bacterium]